MSAIGVVGWLAFYGGLGLVPLALFKIIDGIVRYRYGGIPNWFIGADWPVMLMGVAGLGAWACGSFWAARRHRVHWLAIAGPIVVGLTIIASHALSVSVSAPQTRIGEFMNALPCAAMPAFVIALGALAMADWEPDMFRCPRCGYDTHGLMSHVCPECGEPLSKRLFHETDRRGTGSTSKR